MNCPLSTVFSDGLSFRELLSQLIKIEALKC